MQLTTPSAPKQEQARDDGRPRPAAGGGGRRRSGGAMSWTAAALLSAGLLTAGAVVTLAQDKPPAAPAAPAAPPASKPAGLPSGRPMPVPTPADPNVLTDQQVDQAIRRGADWLLKKFDAKTQWVAGCDAKVKEDESYAGGLDALAVYSLMQCGLALKNERAPDDPALAAQHANLIKELNLRGPDLGKKIEAMMKFDLNKGRHGTYAYGLRATALALLVTSLPETTRDNAELPEQKLKVAARNLLAQDALWCVMATNDGAYTYPKTPKSPATLKELLEYYAAIKKAGKLPVAKGGYDNSNCQYGLLGAWSAAEAEIEIPTLYWYLVANHWTEKQMPNGQWGYSEGAERGGTLTMSCAGLASMLVTHEYIEPAVMSGAVGREPYNVPIKKGLAWFETGNNAIGTGNGYGAYGVERVGLASGFKFFGQNDWYRILAQKIIKAQQADGGWRPGEVGGDLVATTCYYLLFLSRGRHPILMNKLRFDGDAKNPGYWANRPRDAANLARTLGKKIERPLNWQVINVTTPWEEWLDCPILTIASHQPIKFSEAELDKIRNYVYAGGILYTQSDGASPAFEKYAKELAATLFKQDLINVPVSHPIYTTESWMKVTPPVPLKMVTNGSRILMLHSSIDMAKFWQARDDKGKGKQYFEIGANLFLYGSGKRELRNRLDNTWVSEPKGNPVATYGVARVSYPGPYWDPEPNAWKRFANVFWRGTGYKLVPAEVKAEELKPFDASKKPDATNVKFAHLTGTLDKTFTPPQIAGIKAFVESGGVLLVDATGGLNKFDQSAQALLKAAFPGSEPRVVDRNHPLLKASAPGMEDVSSRVVRRTEGVDPNTTGRLQVMTVGKGAVIYSPLDITSGLTGANTSGIAGYDPVYASRLMKNIVIWALDGAKNDAPAAAAGAAPAAAEAK